MEFEKFSLLVARSNLCTTVVKSMPWLYCVLTSRAWAVMVAQSPVNPTPVMLRHKSLSGVAAAQGAPRSAQTIAADSNVILAIMAILSPSYRRVPTCDQRHAGGSAL